MRQAPPSAPAYGVKASIGGFSARNVAQSLQLRFGRLGVRLRSGSALVSMRLQAAGYDGSLRPVRPAEPTASGNHIVYAHAGISEWYVNTPAGLEQGFLLPRASPRRPRFIDPRGVASGQCACDCQAWGLNRSGQLGNGGGPESCHRSPCARLPVMVKDLAGAIGTSAGDAA